MGKLIIVYRGRGIMKLTEKEITILKIMLNIEINAEIKRQETIVGRPKNYLKELEILKGKLK